MCMHMSEPILYVRRYFAVLGAEPHCKPNCRLVKKASYVRTSNKLRQVGGTSCTCLHDFYHPPSYSSSYIFLSVWRQTTQQQLLEGFVLDMVNVKLISLCTPRLSEMYSYAMAVT